MYQFIADTYASYEIPLSECTLLHQVEEPSHLLPQLESIHELIQPKRMNHLMMPINTIELTTWDSSPYSDFVENIGIDLSTSYLFRHSTSDIERRLNQVVSKAPIHIATIATNAYTSHHFPPLIQILKDANIQPLATEIYRAHPVKPGVIVPSLTDAMHTPIADALAELNQTLNTCIDLEQQYLKKVLLLFISFYTDEIVVFEGHRYPLARYLYRTHVSSKHVNISFPGGIQVHTRQTSNY